MEYAPLPWLVPRVSPALNAIIRNLGHRVSREKGDVLYESGRMFERLIFVQSGAALKGVVLPRFGDTLFFASLALPGSLIGGVETLYSGDSMLRRQQAASPCELLTVSTELFLTLADHEAVWHKELAGYSAACVQVDRLGLLVMRAGSMEQRLGVFLYAYCVRSEPKTDAVLEDPAHEWIALPGVPSRKCMAQVIGCEPSAVDAVLTEWADSECFRKHHRSILMKREKLLEYRTWLRQFG